MTEITRAYEFVIFKSSKAIASSTNASPIVVTINAHGMSNGDTVRIAGHLVNTAANGAWVVANKTTNTMQLASSVGNGVGVATGVAYDESNADVTFTDNDFGWVPTWGGWRVNPLEGTSESEPFIVNVLDTGEQVTAALSDSGGRALLMGRLWRLRINEEADGLTTVAQGRLTGVSLGADVASFDFECGDERSRTRNLPIYRNPATPTTQIWPTGLRSQWLKFPVASVGRAVVVKSNTNDVKLHFNRGPQFSGQVLDWVEADRKPDAIAGSTSGSSGHYTYMRANVNGSDAEILSFNEILNSQFLSLRDEQYAGPGFIEVMWVAFAGGHGHSDGDEVELYIHAPSAPPSEALPFHLGGVDGVNLWSELKDRYVEEGIRYDADAFGTWHVSSNPGGLVGNSLVHDAHMRLTEPPTVAEIEDTLCREYGMALFPNAKGEITPRSIMLPFGVNPSALTQVTSAKFGASHPTFQQVGSAATTVLQTSFQQARLLTTEELLESTDHPGDGISLTTIDLPEREHDRVADFGRSVHRLRLSTVFRRGYAVNRENMYFRELVDMYGDGPVRGVFGGLSSLDGILAGDHVVLDLSSYPDLASRARGGKRVVQVLERRMTPHGGEFEYVDAGADDNALTAPAIAIVRNSSRPKHAVDVTISSLSTNAGYTCQLKVGSGNWETRKEGTANETFTVENLPSGTAIQAQAREFIAARVRSDWSSAVSVTLTSLTAPSSVSASASGTTITATFTIGEANSPTMPTLAGADFLQSPLGAGAKRFVWNDLTASTTHTVGFKHVDAHGGASAIATDTATTGTSATLSAPGDITVLQGAPATDSNYPPELTFGAGIEVSIHRTDVHAYLVVQTSVDSFSSIETRRIVEGTGLVRIALPLDNVQRSIRAAHFKAGYTQSAYTATVTAKPTPFVRNASVADGFAGGAASITVDPITGVVSVHINSDDADSTESYYDLNNSAFAAPDTGDTNVSSSAFPYSAASALTLTDGQTAYFWLKFWHPIKQFGQGVKMSTEFNVPNPREPTLEITAESESSGTGTFTVKLADPDGIADAGDLYFRTKTGYGAWSGYGLKSSTPTDAASYSETVTIPETGNAEIEFRLRYRTPTSTGAIQPIHVKSSKFDKGAIPNLTHGAIVADEDAGTVTWEGSCDFDGLSAKIDANVGASPSYPDPTAVGAINVGTGRNFTRTAVDAAYAKFPLSLTAGHTALFAIALYSAADGGGTKSTTNYLFEFNRPLPEPSIAPVDPVVADLGSGNAVTCQVDWNANAAVTDDFGVKIRFGLMGGVQVASATEASPSSTETETATWAGAGGGGSRSWWITAELLDSSGEIIETYLFNNQANTT